MPTKKTHLKKNLYCCPICLKVYAPYEEHYAFIGKSEEIHCCYSHIRQLERDETTLFKNFHLPPAMERDFDLISHFNKILEQINNSPEPAAVATLNAMENFLDQTRISGQIGGMRVLLARDLRDSRN